MLTEIKTASGEIVLVGNTVFILDGAVSATLEEMVCDRKTVEVSISTVFYREEPVVVRVIAQKADRRANFGLRTVGRTLEV